MSPGNEPKVGAKRGPVSRVYEAIGLDEEGDLRVRQAVRGAIRQFIAFVTRYRSALKREARGTPAGSSGPGPSGRGEES